MLTRLIWNFAILRNIFIQEVISTQLSPLLKTIDDFMHILKVKSLYVLKNIT